MAEWRKIGDLSFPFPVGAHAPDSVKAGDLLFIGPRTVVLTRDEPFVMESTDWEEKDGKYSMRIRVRHRDKRPEDE